MNETRGQRLKRLRTAQGVSQVALGKFAGIGQSAISSIESDSRGYGSSIVPIARALNVSPEYLETGENESVSTDWPFQSFTPKQYYALDPHLREEIEDRLFGAIMRQEKTSARNVA